MATTKREDTLSFKKATNLMHRTGTRLMLMHTKEGQRYYIVPGGSVASEIAIRIIAQPNVVIADDGLFPGIPQSWVIG